MMNSSSAAQMVKIGRPDLPAGSTATGQPSGGRDARQSGAIEGKTVWIDIDNSPHVPFFVPIVEELRQQGVHVVLTARDMYQVCELLKVFHLPCSVIGSHYGKNKVLKVLGTFLRAGQLAPTAAKYPDLALSHGSRAQVIICKALGIPTIVMHDYEHSVKTGFLESDWILMPDVIPDGAMSKKNGRVLKYPGLKEDVYVPRFRPDSSILANLGIRPEDLVVTLRPPATEAHYHNPESELLFSEVLRFLAATPEARVIMLPRNARQNHQLQAEWSGLLAGGRVLIPATPVDGLNLIWFSDLVISGGGTMNREAAALGVPVYSIFRGKLGAVDRHLAQEGRLILLETPDDIHTKLRLVRRERPASPESTRPATLQTIVAEVLAILAGKNPAISDSVRQAA